MAGRVYKIPFDNVTIGTAVQDIFSLLAAASKGIVLHSIHLESTNASPAALRMRLKRGTATVTQGSAGTNVTPAAASSKDQGTHAGTYHVNDTTQATTSGAFYTLGDFNWDTVLPFDYLPPPEDRDDCQAGEILILDLPATVAAVVVSGVAVVEELT